MSGIIGGVGSKSGIIDRTEIQGGYEEGSFTPKVNGVSGTSVAGYYIRIGNSVNVSLNYDNTGLTDSNLPSGTHAYISDLPFISTSNTNYVCKFWFDWGMHDAPSNFFTVSGHMGASQDRFYLYKITGAEVDQTTSGARVTGSVVGTDASGARLLIRGGSTYHIDDY